MVFLFLMLLHIRSHRESLSGYRNICKYLTLLLQKNCLENATTDLREGTDQFTEAPIIANDVAQWNFRANLGLRVS